MPLDHITLTVPKDKFESMITFLKLAMAPSGLKEMARPIPNLAGLGDSGSPYLWLHTMEPDSEEVKGVNSILKKQHIAFTAKNSEEVRQFHAAALKAGGTCNGPPGKTQCHPGDYAAFVLDPACGINFEVCFHGGE